MAQSKGGISTASGAPAFLSLSRGSLGISWLTTLCLESLIDQPYIYPRIIVPHNSTLQYFSMDHHQIFASPKDFLAKCSLSIIEERDAVGNEGVLGHACWTSHNKEKGLSVSPDGLEVHHLGAPITEYRFKSPFLLDGSHQGPKGHR